MGEFFKSFGGFLGDLVEILGPVIIFFFNLAVLVGLVKWSARTKERIKVVASNPVLIFVWILSSIVGIILFYKYVIPLFK